MKYFVLSIWLAGGCGGGGAAGRGDGPIAPVTPVTRGGSTAAAPAGEPFPLAPGAEWTFRGTTRSGDESGNVVNLTVTWKMKVLDVIERAGWHAAAMQGHPRDVVGFGGDAQASEYLILWKDGRYYEPGEAAATLARLRDPKDDLAKLVSEDDLILRLPLAVGDKYCPADSPDELSPRYCWSVESNEAFARAGSTCRRPRAAGAG